MQSIGKEIELRKSELTTPIETIYIGGGTPSLLTYEELSYLFESLYQQYNIIQNPEITLEANPDDLKFDYLKKLQKTPINRLSIGVQSFHDSELRLMNRTHTSETAKVAIQQTQDIGIDNITIDLIYGIQGSNTDTWQSNLTQFKDLVLPHLSAYALTVEEKTALHHFIKTQKLPPTDDNLAFQQFEQLQKFASENGFHQYELSNFAKEKYRSKHNSAYWLGKPYLGFGPSAHSRIGNIRSWNVSSNHLYIKSLQEYKLPSTQESLTTKEHYNEYIMTRLRTDWGIDLDYIATVFGTAFSDYFERLATPYFQNNQLQKTVENQIKIKPEAYFLSNAIIADLFMV